MDRCFKVDGGDLFCGKTVRLADEIAAAYRLRNGLGQRSRRKIDAGQGADLVVAAADFAIGRSPVALGGDGFSGQHSPDFFREQ